MTTTAHDIATAIHHKHGVDFDFAAEAVEAYIARMEYLEGREIDRDGIPENDADFIAGAFASAQRAGDFAVPELEDVADAADAADEAQNSLDQARSDRDRAIRHAIARGARIVDVMAVAGVSRARVDQIRKGGR